MTTLRTKIMELLDAHGIAYRILRHSQPVFTVEEAAVQRGVVIEEMVKSILLREKAQPRRYVMACVNGNARLDPPAVRAHLPAAEGWKRLTFATTEEILIITGCVQGAVAPLALPPDIPVIFDEEITHYAKANISSGDPMAGLELEAQDLIRLAGARLAPIAIRDT